MTAKRNPATARARAAEARRPPALVGSALARMLSDYMPPASAEAFQKWRMLPETCLFIDCLRELALNPSHVNPDTDSFEVQYGVTSGLQLAAGLLSDPSSVFSYLFTGLTPGAREPLETAYTTEPDGDGVFGGGE